MGLGQIALSCVLLTTILTPRFCWGDGGKGADIQLRAKWNSSTLAHEAAESLVGGASGKARRRRAPHEQCCLPD